jgi:hypothetical protein
MTTTMPSTQSLAAVSTTQSTAAEYTPSTIMTPAQNSILDQQYDHTQSAKGEQCGI